MKYILTILLLATFAIAQQREIAMPDTTTAKGVKQMELIDRYNVKAKQEQGIVNEIRVLQNELGQVQVEMSSILYTLNEFDTVEIKEPEKE